MIIDLVHFVRQGETLSSIAKQFGTTVDALANENKLENRDYITVGQRLEIPNKVGKVDILFLDKLCMPIPGLAYRLEYAGKTEDGITGENGMAKPLKTSTPDTKITILVKKIEGGYKVIGQATSDTVDKFFTLISPKIKLTDKTEQHEGTANAAPAKNSPISSGPEPHKQPASKGINDKGHPVATYADPVADWFDRYLKSYCGDNITDATWHWAARELGCEPEVIMAIAHQESGTLSRLGLGGFDKKHRPTILYERHIFGQLTQHAFDMQSPDLSSRKPYKSGSARDKKGKRIDDGKHYGLYGWQYGKLFRARNLNEKAAIMACSWGKFQVMGSNYRICGFSSVYDFLTAVCTSELEQLKIMIRYCKGVAMSRALQTKNWSAIAQAYNGPGYRANDYDKKIHQHYLKICRERGIS